MNRNKKNKGFTLIELLVVVAVIAILGSVAITAYVGSTLKASRSEAYANLSALRMFEEQIFSERSIYTTLAADFPGFEPWQPTAVSDYTYAIMGLGIALPAPPVAVPYNGVSVASANCFVATAVGNAGTRVAGDIFAIDCNDNKNF